MVLRNVVPRQGTEIFAGLNRQAFYPIEKCSSPTGDGNDEVDGRMVSEKRIEKCSSPTGDGNENSNVLRVREIHIEKCSSPTGDGNSYNTFVSYVSPTFY